MREKNYTDIDTLPPDEFVSWVFPKLFKSRLPRYQAIADTYGYTLNACDVANVKDDTDFIQLIAAAIDQQTP